MQHDFKLTRMFNETATLRLEGSSPTTESFPFWKCALKAFSRSKPNDCSDLIFLIGARNPTPESPLKDTNKVQAKER